MLFRCVVVSLALTLLFSGCGDNGGRVPVTGTVNFDGKPLEDGSVVFSGDKGAAGIGKIVNGNFSLSESGEQEGVQPGTRYLYNRGLRNLARFSLAADSHPASQGFRWTTWT